MAVDHDNNAKAIAGDDLPDWLREIRGDSSVSKSAEPDQASTKSDVSVPDANVADAQEDNLPAWLQDVRGKEPLSQATKPVDLPIEPAEPEPEPEPVIEPVENVETAIEQTAEVSPSPTESDVTDVDDDLQRLLAEEGIELDTLSEDRPEGAEDMSVRDWIAATSVDSPLAKAREAEEETKAQQSTEPEAEIVESIPTTSVEDSPALEDDLPAWLSEDQPTTSSPETSSWLADESSLDDMDIDEPIADIDMASDEAASINDIAADDLPSWLQEERSAPSEADAASWLTDESAFDETELVDAAQVEAEIPEDTSTVIEDDISDAMPSWLQEERSTTTEAGAASWLTDESDLDDIPDATNLEDIEADDSSIEAVASVSDDEDDLPDWLRSDDPAEIDSDAVSWLTDEASLEDSAGEVSADIDVDTVAEEAEITTSDNDGFVDEDGLPDWLREDAVAEADADTPSWLTDEAVHEDDTSVVADEEIDIFDDVANVDDILANATDVNADLDEDLPDWLATDSGSDDAPSLDTSTTFDAVDDENITDDNIIDYDGVVDTDDLPDWLREEEDGTDDIESAVGDALPNWVADEADAENGVPQDADILDAFATENQSAEPLDTEAEAENAGLSSEAPEWLDKLRESDDADTSDDEADAGIAIEVPALAAQPISNIEDATEFVSEAANDISSALSEDVTAKLSVAKATLEAGDLDEALTIFQDLIAESQGMNEVIATLSANLEHFKNESTIYETLADAQVRQGLLSQALETYQTALQKI